MKFRTIIIIFTIILNSCSSTENKQSIDNRIIGHWKTEGCLLHFVHAVYPIQLPDTAKIPQHRIKTDFSIEFNPDTSFVFDNDNGPTETGKYKLADSSLTLTLNNEQLWWLNFHIDSITDNRLILSAETILFYSKTADTIKLFTGDKVKISMNRQ
jgi:hypothetical protein